MKPRHHFKWFPAQKLIMFIGIRGPMKASLLLSGKRWSLFLVKDEKVKD